MPASTRPARNMPISCEAVWMVVPIVTSTHAACMNQHCREAIQKYCVEWLEEIVDQDLNDVVRSMNADPNLHIEGGSVSMRRHSEQVQHLAAVILAKLRVSRRSQRSQPSLSS